MTIQGDFYRITQVTESSPFWDLELLKEIKSKTNPRKEYQIDGYGMPLESALLRIIRYATSQKLDETATLVEYLNAFKQVKKEILDKVKV